MTPSTHKVDFNKICKDYGIRVCSYQSLRKKNYSLFIDHEVLDSILQSDGGVAFTVNGGKPVIVFDADREGIAYAPSESELARYLADVSAVRSALTMQDNTPLLPDSVAGMTWIGANNIERVLAAVEDSIRRMEQSWFYFGEVYCGEV